MVAMKQDFWDRLAFALKTKDTGLVEVAKVNSININTLYNDRHFKRYPKLEHIMAISKTLDVSVDWLLFGGDVADMEVFRDYLNAPKAVRDIVTKILKDSK